jgi:hypothetical protein
MTIRLCNAYFKIQMALLSINRGCKNKEAPLSLAKNEFEQA